MFTYLLTYTPQVRPEYDPYRRGRGAAEREREHLGQQRASS